MSVGIRPTFFDDLRNISRRASRTEGSVALEILTSVKHHLPPGEIEASNGRRSLGWIVLSHLCSDVRALLLSEHALWSEVVSAFPRMDAINALSARAHSHPLSVDFDLLCSSNSSENTLQCLDFFVNFSADVPRASLLNAEEISFSSAFENPYTNAVRALLLSLPRIMDSRQFCNLVTLTLHIVGRVAPFHAPLLQDLTLIGTRIQEATETAPESIIFGWKKSPVLTVDHFQHIIRGSPFLSTLELRGLRVEGDANGVPFTRRTLRQANYQLRQPDSIRKAFSCVRAIASARTCAIARLNYSSPLPSWVWQFSGLTRDGSLALVVESCRSMVWLTVLSAADAALASRPVFCDQHDAFNLSIPRKDRPTLYVRRGRISRLYIPETAPIYLQALVRDVHLFSPRVDIFYALELVLNIDGHDVWLRPSKILVEHIFRPLTNVSSLVIEDERLAHLPLYKSVTCTSVHYVCRGDWYGESGMSYFTQAVVKQRAALSDVRIRGASRVCDDDFCQAVQNLSRLSGKVHVERDFRSATPARPPLSIQLDNARDLVQYRQMQILAIQAEIDIQRGGLI